MDAVTFLPVRGSGADRFIFLAAADSAVAGGTDTIRWFGQRVDRIDLSAIDAILGPGNNAFSFTGAGPFTAAGQLRAVAGVNSTLIRGDSNGDGTADITITHSGVYALTGADFAL